MVVALVGAPAPAQAQDGLLDDLLPLPGPPPPEEQPPPPPPEPPTSPTTPPPGGRFFGLVPNAELGSGEFDMMRQGNVGGVRVLFVWPGIEGPDDSFNWAYTDGMIGNLAARGIEPVAVLFGSANVASRDYLELPVGSRRATREWKEWVGKAVRRYGPGGAYWKGAFKAQHPGSARMPIRAWQVWNEQNSPAFVHPKPSVARYATLVRRSHQAISGIDRGAEVVLGGMADAPSLKPWSFLSRLYAIRRAKRWFEGVALHPYARGFRAMREQIKRSREVVARHDRRVPIWITELGWSSDPGGGSKLSKTPGQQARLLERSFKLLTARRKRWRIEGVFWYTWRDSTAGVCAWCDTAGLVDLSLGAKPAWRAFTRIAGAS